MILTLIWIFLLTFVMAFTLKNMFYLQKEGQIRNLLLTPQEYAKLFPSNSLEVDKEEFIQYLIQDRTSYSGTSVCFDETGNVIVTLRESRSSKTPNRMWIHGRLKRNYEHSKGDRNPKHREEMPVYPIPDGAQDSMLKLAASLTGTTAIGLALYYSSTPMKNFIGLTIQLGWMGANIYWLELVEGGFSKLMDAIICGLARFKPFY
jgi:hypothetical protein